jgi:excisionase family DNA binding protein
MNATSDLLTLRELLAFLRISRATAYRLLADGLPCIGAGRLRRFDREAVLRWWKGEPETQRDRQGPLQATPPAAPSPLLASGVYECAACHGRGTLREPLPAERVRCPRCGHREVVRVGALPGTR